MLGVEHVAFVFQRFFDCAILVQLLFDPQRTCHRERLETTRRDPQVRLEDPFELEEWLVVKSDEREIVDADSALLEAVASGANWERRIAFYASEALLTSRSD